MEVRIVSKVEIVLSGKSLSKIKKSYEHLPILSNDAIASGAGFCGVSLVEDISTQKDLTNEWDECI